MTEPPIRMMFTLYGIYVLCSRVLK